MILKEILVCYEVLQTTKFNEFQECVLQQLIRDYTPNQKLLTIFIK